MLSWREKVADKLFRLLADSQSSPSPPIADSPIASHESQAMSFSSEEFTTPKKSTFSSLPTSSGVDAEKPNSLACQHSRRTLSSHLLPAPLACSVDSRTESESDETVESLKEKLDLVSERNISRSNGTEEASASHDSEDYLSYLSEKSAFISADLFEFLQSCLPNIVKGCQWVLLYSTWKHGISLHTLLRRSVNLPGPCLLIAGDMKGAIFGGLLDSPLKPTTKRKYQGTNQTFVFTTIFGEPRLFRATGSNRYYYLCLNDLLAFGGGANFALRLDEDLLHGMSGPCETFGNLCLAHSAEFELKNVEKTYPCCLICLIASVVPSSLFKYLIILDIPVKMFDFSLIKLEAMGFRSLVTISYITVDAFPSTMLGNLSKSLERLYSSSLCSSGYVEPFYDPPVERSKAQKDQKNQVPS